MAPRPHRAVTVKHKQKDDDERALFREAMRGVKPLVHEPRAPLARPAPAARAAAGRKPFSHAGDRLVRDEGFNGVTGNDATAAGDELVFRRPGVQEARLRRLRRGQYPVEAEIDLHGLTTEAARLALRDFLDHALAEGMQCVRIVHGKGLRSGTRGPVLRSVVTSLLRRTSSVVAFVPARPADGGTGALYVLLNRSSARTAPGGGTGSPR
nr:MAG: DNA mismatch repair protein MutS [Pseudomonadota bacterium]